MGFRPLAPERSTMPRSRLAPAATVILVALLASSLTSCAPPNPDDACPAPLWAVEKAVQTYGPSYQEGTVTVHDDSMNTGSDGSYLPGTGGCTYTIDLPRDDGTTLRSNVSVSWIYWRNDVPFPSSFDEADYASGYSEHPEWGEGSYEGIFSIYPNTEFSYSSEFPMGKADVSVTMGSASTPITDAAVIESVRPSLLKIIDLVRASNWLANNPAEKQ
jgi:hypothetical protein